MKTVSATAWIDASPMKVWAILTDLSRYQDWNPLFREASGEIAVGRRIFLRSLPGRRVADDASGPRSPRRPREPSWGGPPACPASSAGSTGSS